MKRNITKLLSLILCTLLILCMLPACSDMPNLLKMENPERADAFFDLASRDPADSYAIEIDSDISGSLYGVKVEAKLNSESIYVNLDSNSPIYHTEGNSVIKMGTDGAETTQTTKTVSGFRDGKIHESSDRDGTKNALVSDISAKDYQKHIESLLGYTDKELSAIHKSASVKECEQNEDGTWSASYSGYDEESINAIIRYCFDTSVLMLDGYKVSDVILKIDATEDCVSTEWVYELVFERTDMTNLYPEPKAITTLSFEDIGTAEAPELDFSSYTEVEGLAALQSIRNILNEMSLSDSGSFTTDNSQNVSLASSVQLTEEIDVVTYKTENGKFTFDIDATVNPRQVTGAVEVDVVYKDGEFRMSGKEIDTQAQAMTDAEARIYITRLFDPAGLVSALISDIDANAGKYTHAFTIADPDYSAFEVSLAPMGAGNFKANASVDVVYEDGVLKEYKYNFELTATVNGQTLTVEATSTITFNIGTDNEM